MTRTYYPSFDDIVFANRNKEYGAYVLRKKYTRTMALSIILGILIIVMAAIIPFIRAKSIAAAKARDANEVIAQMANDIQLDQAAPPPPPPPPPPTEQQTVVKYVAPVVVDTVKPEEQSKLMIAEEAVETVVDKEVVEVVEVVEAPKEEVEYEAPAEVFVAVEEMPSFPGGDAELFKFIYENVKYPDIAMENNIQGKVIVRFCVTYKGTVDQVSVLRGVDPTLDEEAIRVIKMLPKWKPGKQGGKPVNVWYTVPISFQLK